MGSADTALGDGGPATAASLYNPVSVAVDNKGNVYVTDGGHARIRMVNAAGIITTVVGHGATGYTGDGGPATAAGIQDPRNIKFDKAGNMYFADYGNMVVRKVDTFGIITTVAGDGYESSPGVGGYSGDGGLATAAELSGPAGVAVDKWGNIYISDFMNNVIRKVDTFGIINTIIDAWSVSGPQGLSVDTSGDLYYTDVFNDAVDEIVVNCIPTAIGGADSLCTGATTLPTNTAGGGVWTVTNGHASIAPSGNLTGLTTGYDTVTYTTTNVCGTNSVSKVVSIQSPLITAPVTGLDSVCAGSGIPLADTSAGGSWSVANTHASISALGVLSGLSAGPDTVIYSISNSCGTSHSSKLVVVNPLPFAGILSGEDSVCTGDTIMLSGVMAGGSWTASITGVSVAGGVVTGVSVGFDTISYTLTSGCTSVVSKVVYVNTLPGVAAIAGAASLCAGATIALTDTTNGGTWMSSNATATVASGLVAGMSPGTDTIYYSVTNTCGPHPAIKIITINPLPDAGAISGDSSVCIGGIVSLADTGGGGIWHSISNGIATISATTGTLFAIAPGTDTIKFSVTNSCGTASAMRIQTVNPMPSPIMGGNTVCLNNIRLLLDTIPGGTWSSADMAIATVDGLGVVRGVSPGTTVITYALPTGCGVSDTVSVNTLPSQITGDTTVCLGGGLTLHDSTGGGAWSALNMSVATVDSSSGVVVGLAAGISNIYYTTPAGCRATLLIHVDSCALPTINEVKIFPDPATSEVTIYSSGSLSTIAIYTAEGKLLFHDNYSNAKEVQLDVALFPAGLYFIRVNDGTVLRFVKL